VKHFLKLSGAIAMACPLLWFVADAQSQEKGNAQDEAGIRKVVDNLITAFNSHDVKALVSSFHTDAEFTNVIGMTAHGRMEIEAFHKPLFAANRPQGIPWFGNAVLKKDGEPVIRFLRPDVASADHRWIMTGVVLPDGKEAPERKGLAIPVLTKENGNWAIASFHNLEIDPAIPMDTPKPLKK
jgi:uncharacterized protein (TIGR02246 family)